MADNRVTLALRERSPDHQHQNLHEVENHPEDDYLEILDLENPLSPSSSSESSCVTISSDDWFDSEALMQEIDPENNQRNAGYVSAPVKPNMVVVLPATSGLSSFSTFLYSTLIVVVVFMTTISIIIIFLNNTYIFELE